MRIKLDMTKEHGHTVFWRKLSRKLNEITNKENHAENKKNNLSITVKKTRKRASRGGRSIRVEMVPPTIVWLLRHLKI